MVRSSVSNLDAYAFLLTIGNLPEVKDTTIRGVLIAQVTEPTTVTHKCRIHMAANVGVLESPIQVGIQFPGLVSIQHALDTYAQNTVMPAQLLTGNVFFTGHTVYGRYTAYPSVYKINADTENWYATCGINSRLRRVVQVKLIDWFEPDLVAAIIASYHLRDLNT